MRTIEITFDEEDIDEGMAVEAVKRTEYWWAKQVKLGVRK